jgi:hypothetical protein
MKSVKVELTLEELTLLASLASDQLFRREFIDPKIPGYKSNPAEVRMGKALVGRLQLIIGQDRAENGSHRTAPGGNLPASPAKRSAGTNGGI